MEELVYCKKCRWLKEYKMPYVCYIDRSCNHQDNLKHIPDYFDEKTGSDKHPRIINKNNDCKWFEEKISLWNRLGEWFNIYIIPPKGHGP